VKFVKKPILMFGFNFESNLSITSNDSIDA
jgi:hypothetical protein